MSRIAPRSVVRLAQAALGGLALSLAALSGACAQYYRDPPPGYVGPAPGQHRRGPPQSYYYGGPTPDYYRGGPPQRYDDDGYYRPRRRVAAGNVCVTARGACEHGRYYPVGSSCVCIIPGFGKKRGVIQY
jgi:hypothetical protein